MLHIHHANRFETLTALLLAHLGRGPADAFAAEQIIVPSTAVRRALTLAIAQHRRVCTQVQFSYLAQWLWQQMARCLPGVPAQSPLAPPVLAWRVHAAFGDPAFVAPHPRLAAYLQGADEVMRFTLAQRCAGLLDQLLTYRTDWLAAWSAGASALTGHAQLTATATADERWQADLWRRCTLELAGHGTAMAPPLELLAEFGQALQAGTALPGLPAQAHVFALPTMPPLHNGLLQQLGQHVDVHVYVLNPCREYWFELIAPRQLSHLAARGREHGHEVGNRLLSAWGRQTQAHIDLLVDRAGESALDDGHFDAHPGGTLLAQLHNAMLDMTELAPGSVVMAADDRSVELHVCHSLTRELEVLHDHLLGLFKSGQASGQPLRPGQVLVVVPDLEAAAPLIDAVFSTTPAARRIPFTITGRGSSRQAGPAHALLSLLALAGSRFVASEVLALLQQAPLALRFGLGAAQLQQVLAWMQASGMRWALDGAHRASLGLPADERHTLNDGLARLWLGYASPEQATEPFLGLLPAGDVEGSPALLLGALQAFIDALAGLRSQLAQPHPPAAWEALLLHTLDNFMQADGDQLDDMRALRDVVHELAGNMQRGGGAQPVAAAVVRAALEQALDDPARGGVPTGRVTFSAMSSLRSLPFAVVCAIGLDDGVFPSADRPLEFDLMARLPRRGDRQRRQDERNLFLDLLLAARHSLYLSHTGRSVRDNAALPPSVLVSELLDVLVPAIASDPDAPDSLAAARQRLVVQHPLQPFALEAFTPGPEPRLRSFNQELAQALRASLHARADVLVQGLATGPGRGANVVDVVSKRGMQDRVQDGLQSGFQGGQLDDLTDGSADSPPDGSPDRSPDTADDDDCFTAEPLAPFFTTPLAAPDATWRQVPLARLAEFLRNPSRHLLRRRLGLALHRDDDTLDDDEPLLPDWRGRSALAQRLLPALLRGDSAQAVARLAQAGTEWPAGALGRSLLHTELGLLQRFAAQVRQASAAPCLAPLRLQVTVLVDGQAWVVQGTLADLRPGGLVRWRYDDSRPGDYLEAWLLHLLRAVPTQSAAPPTAGLTTPTPTPTSASAPMSGATQWLSRDGSFQFGPVDNAPAVLAQLLQLYARGLCEPVHFFPKSAWAYMTGGRKLGKAQARWRSSTRAPHGEDSDPAYTLALRGVVEPLDAQFEGCAEQIFGPLLASLQDPRVTA